MKIFEAVIKEQKNLRICNSHHHRKAFVKEIWKAKDGKVMFGKGLNSFLMVNIQFFTILFKPSKLIIKIN